jgi:hypothetical protein
MKLPSSAVGVAALYLQLAAPATSFTSPITVTGDTYAHIELFQDIKCDKPKDCFSSKSLSTNHCNLDPCLGTKSTAIVCDKDVSACKMTQFGSEKCQGASINTTLVADGSCTPMKCGNGAGTINCGYKATITSEAYSGMIPPYAQWYGNTDCTGELDYVMSMGICCTGSDCGPKTPPGGSSKYTCNNTGIYFCTYPQDAACNTEETCSETTGKPTDKCIDGRGIKPYPPPSDQWGGQVYSCTAPPPSRRSN